MATCTTRPSVENVLQELKELFGSVFHVDVIKKVADSCQYDVVKSTNRLLEISTNSPALFPPKQHEPKPVNGLKTSASFDSVNKNKSRKSVDIERTIGYINQGFKVLVILRGLPGSGKSTLSRRILESTIGYDINHKIHILSTDDFFYLNRQGVYNYDVTMIEQAHNWNQRRAFEAMSRGFSPVIIDNTNVQMWELKPYATMATDYGYIIEILEPDTHWCFDHRELAKRNQHNVPVAKIRDMLERYEKNITSRKLLTAYNLNYRLQRPPQCRLYPPLKLHQPEAKNSNTEETLKGAALLNSCVEDVLPIETINLMDFEEETLVKPSVLENERNNNTCEQNLLDKILLCNNNTGTSGLLQPEQKTMMDIVVIKSDSEEDNELVEGNKKLFPDIETAWGVKESSLQSWDVVTPIKDDYKPPQKKSVRKAKILTAEAGVNTEDTYLQLLACNRLDVGFINGLKVIETINRDINRSTPKKEFGVLKIPKLDKSCMTEDVYEDYENHMSQLTSLFPHVPFGHLKYWYNKCKGDLEWTIEFLLEAKEEIVSYTDKSEEPEVINEPTTTQTNQTDTDSSDSNNEEEPNRARKSKGKPKTTEEHKELKKIIESKIDIDRAHYSKHLLKVKHYKFGSSGNLEIQRSSSENSEENTTPSTSKHEKCMTDAGEVIIIDDDIEFDEVEIQDTPDKPGGIMEDTIELNLGEQFVSQLEAEFGDPELSYPKGFQPVVQLPLTLARQLYTFYLESVYQQMDNQKQVLEALTKEDEEFARKLQAKEQEEEASNTPTLMPNLQDIMEEQYAQNQHQKEIDKWKDLNPDNMAARMTRQKLFAVFPAIEKNTLIEILYAHNNNYRDTVESLVASTGLVNVQGNIEAIMEPPIKEEVIQEMKEAQKGNIEEEYDEVHEANFYRKEAQKYLKRRQELYQKAQQYFQKGLYDVAQFFSGLATKQTEYYERTNSRAATAFLDEHFKRLQDFNTLDLHYLHVKEAMEALDVYLDRNINLLRSSSKKRSEYLQIITGRGKRSESGIAKIRPAVHARLKKRKINFVQLNPGLVKIKITKNTLNTSELLQEC